MSSKIRRFENMSAAEISLLPKSQTVFFFPLGVLEDHGPHLPTGLDLRIAEAFCQATLERLETEVPGTVGVLMPSAPLSVSGSTSRLALVSRPHVVRDYLIDSATNLFKNGFQNFVAWTSELSPAQVTAVEDAGRMLKGRLGYGFWRSLFKNRKNAPLFLCPASALITREQVFRSPLWSLPEDHGGERDTSLALAICPEQVNPLYLELKARPLPSRGFARWSDIRFNRAEGYVGNPSLATAEKGRQILIDTVSDILPKLRAALSGSDPALIFRSWYSVFPPNRSLFRSWVLALTLCLLLTAWMIFSLEMMTKA